MMDVKESLKSLPPPDPRAPGRIWRRLNQRGQARTPLRWALPLTLAVAAAAAVATVLVPQGSVPAQERSLELSSTTGHTEAVAWSQNVRFTFDGTGSVHGKPDDLVIDWQDGTLHAEVVPGTGTGLTVTTDEATVDVVGTVFEVHRDALGTVTTVSRGKVRVTCSDGWSGSVTPESGPQTCAPTRPAMLLGRASTLRDRGQSAGEVLSALDRGLELAPEESAIRGELLALRMEVLSDAGRYPEAIRDAEAYRALGGPRSVEVTRFAAWLALSHGGCEQGVPYLEALAEQATSEDRILLAECLVATDPHRARRLVRAVDPEGLSPTWSERADTVMGRLTGGPR